MANFTLQQLTEGIKQRHVGVQNKRLVEKWTRTGLLRGLDDVNRENMSQLLENQASQLLREANTLGNDQVKGFTSIAFPIVRRVFGGLVANELVSIQPMSLPSGLLFYLDYTYGSNVGGSSSDTSSATYKKGESIYNNPTGKDIQKGSFANGGQYDLLGSGFSKLHVNSDEILGSLTDGVGKLAYLSSAGVATYTANTALPALDLTNPTVQKLLQFDQQILDSGESWSGILVSVKSLKVATKSVKLDKSHIKEFALNTITPVAQGGDAPVAPGSTYQSGGAINIRRLNQIVRFNAAGVVTPDFFAPDTVLEANDADAFFVGEAHVLCIVKNATLQLTKTNSKLKASFVKEESIETTALDLPETVIKPDFESNFDGDETGKMGGVGITPVIPEIDIKIESIPVTTTTRKLRARWSPELAQDLNAYHSLDAEVELTQILSEQIALEIDREILNDLLTQAQGANFFWSRAPGKFVNKRTGAEIARTSTLASGPAFTGTVREWYETLTETIIDVANEIHRKTLRGSANFIVVSPDVATVLEASVLYRPSYSIDGDGQVASPFTMGAEKIGSLSNRFTVYKDPYFPRNKILVGYKGGSYLETGFVYAPYVPLIVTPTIFAPEDFTPRKGVMTRYGKKMVRADFYGTVTCLDMNII